MFIDGAPDLVLRTDHKPLVSLFGQKPLSELNPRLQRLRMRLLRYSYTIEDIAGKSLLSPDTGRPKSHATRSFAVIFLVLITQVAESDFWMAKGPPILENITA